MKKALVLSGDGINCEKETASAFELVGGASHIIHVNEFLNNFKCLEEFGILALPGGFSFGDEVRSGLVLARKIEATFKGEVANFVKRGGLVIGICNGFQVLCQLGFFGDVTLAHNEGGKFINRWVELECHNISSPWLSGLERKKLCLPIRHGEGRLLMGECPRYQSALSYCENVNGSFENNAGILDTTGRILGLMPHPEAALQTWLHPFSEGAQRNVQLVKKIFKNGVSHAQV